MWRELLLFFVVSNRINGDKLVFFCYGDIFNGSISKSLTSHPGGGAYS